MQFSTHTGLNLRSELTATLIAVVRKWSLPPSPPDASETFLGEVTRVWRDVAAAAGARPAEIRRMESAFEHDDLVKALAL